MTNSYIEKLIVLLSLYKKGGILSKDIKEVSSFFSELNVKEILGDLQQLNLLSEVDTTYNLNSNGKNLIRDILSPQIEKELFFVDKNKTPSDNLVNLIINVDKDNFCGGVVPLHLLSLEAQEKLNLSISELHSLLISLETDQKIYLEPINDPTRLTDEQKRSAIYDQVRGTLFYVGRWN